MDNTLMEILLQLRADHVRTAAALEQIAAHLKGLRAEGIVVWGGVEPEEN